MTILLVVPKRKLVYNFRIRRWIMPYSAIYDYADFQTYLFKGADGLSNALVISLAIRSLPSEVPDEEVEIMRFEYVVHARQFLRKLIKDEDSPPFLEDRR